MSPAAVQKADEGAPPGPPSDNWPEEPLDRNDERLFARRPRIGRDRMIWVTTGDRRAALQIAADDIYGVVNGFFQDEAKRMAKHLGAQPEVPSPDQIETAVKRALDEYDWTPWYSVLRPQLEGVIRQAVVSGVNSTWEALAKANVSLTWDMIAPRAVHYAAQRAAELVGMHVMPDGTVVPAQDAKLRIDQATRRELHFHITSLMEEGRSWSDIAKELERYNQNGTFMSDWRARRIARTEASFAFNRGSIAAFRQAGFEQVRVVDGVQDDICAAVNGQIWTIDEAEANPLGHPHCSRHFAAVLPDIENGKVPGPSTPLGRQYDEPPETFANTAEAEAWARARWPDVQWDFAEADPRAARAIVAQTHKLMAEFPDVAKRITYVGTYAGPGAWRKWEEWGESTWAVSWSDGAIAFNPRYVRNYDEFVADIRRASEVKENYKGKLLPFHAPGKDKGIEAVVTHEFAHQIQYWIERDTSGVAFMPAVRGDGFGLFSGTFSGLNSRVYAERPITFYGTEEGGGNPLYEAWADTVEAAYWGSPEIKRTAQVQSAKAMLELVKGPKYYQGDWKWTQYMERGNPEWRAAIQRYEELKQRLRWPY